MRASRTLPDKAGPQAIAARLPDNAGVLVIIIAVLVALQDRFRQRRHLRDLDDRLLEDVGLSREDVRRETSKPLWIR